MNSRYEGRRNRARAWGPEDEVRVAARCGVAQRPGWMELEWARRKRLLQHPSPANAVSQLPCPPLLGQPGKARTGPSVMSSTGQQPLSCAQEQTQRTHKLPLNYVTVQRSDYLGEVTAGS